MPKLKRIDISKKGMRMFFSETELRVLEHLWSRQGPTTASEIAEALGGVKVTTVTCLLKRLVNEGYVRRSLDTSGTRLRYLYFAAASREETRDSLVDRVVRALVNGFGNHVVHAFPGDANREAREGEGETQ